MAGLCGWFTQPGSSADADAAATLREMSAALPAHRTGSAQFCAANHAGSVLALCDDAGATLDQQLAVVIDGFPRWRDSELARIAARDGMLASISTGYARHGQQVFGRLGGSFAVALHDLRTQTTLLAVDNMGRRPLCYATLPDGGVAFASTATALRAHPAVDADVDPQAIYNYVYFHTVPSPRTAFTGVHKIKPAHVVTLHDGTTREERHWTPAFDHQRGLSADTLLPVIRDAVQRHRTSSNTGCFLSGGLDSSTVAGVLNEQVETPARAFTIGFAQEGYDEIEFARVASRHFHLELNDYYITAADVAGAFGEVARAYDEPFGNSSAVPALICARLAASRGVDTLLAGDGGDELFAGNQRYATQKLFGMYQILPGALRRGLLEPFFGRESVRRRSSGLQHKVRRYIEQANVPLPERTQSYNFLHTTAPDEVFSAEFLGGVDRNEPLRALAEEYNASSKADQLDRLLQLDWKFTLADNDLRKVDRMCDLAGITVHFPLLDDALIDYSLRVPSSAKLRRFELRSFYKQSMRNFLPREIIDKTKHGFGLPFGEWLKQDDDLRDLVADRIAALKTRGVFSSDYLEKLREQHASQHAAYFGNLVWVLAMFEEWCQQHRLSL